MPDDVLSHDAQAIDQAVAAIVEREAYRDVMLAAIHLLHTRELELQALRQQLSQAKDEYRLFRAAIMREALAQ